MNSMSILARFLRVVSSPTSGWQGAGCGIGSRAAAMLSGSSSAPAHDLFQQVVIPRRDVLFVLAPFIAGSAALFSDTRQALALTKNEALRALDPRLAPPERAPINWTDPDSVLPLLRYSKLDPRYNETAEKQRAEFRKNIGFQTSPSGLLFKDFKIGGGGLTAKPGDVVIIDWAGVTVGNGREGQRARYFQTQNKSRDPALEGYDNPDFITFHVGDGSVIPGVDEAVRGMTPGGIRRVLVPDSIGYPLDGFAKIGPKPSTPSGQRMLGDFLSSKFQDKTLMFDLKLLKVMEER